MEYELVIQWHASGLGAYDSMVQFEDRLIAELEDDCQVDGHDMGAGEMNIFIHTNSPPRALEQVKAVLGSEDLWPGVRIAARKFTENQYEVLWPPDDRRGFRVA